MGEKKSADAALARREDVIRALDYCITGNCPEDCPMKDEEWRDAGEVACEAFNRNFLLIPDDLLNRVLAMLKEENHGGV